MNVVAVGKNIEQPELTLVAVDHQDRSTDHRRDTATIESIDMQLINLSARVSKEPILGYLNNTLMASTANSVLSPNPESAAFVINKLEEIDNIWYITIKPTNTVNGQLLADVLIKNNVQNNSDSVLFGVCGVSDAIAPGIFTLVNLERLDIVGYKINNEKIWI